MSELTPGRRPLPPKAASWLAAREPLLHLGTVTLAEIERGIEQLRRQEKFKPAENLSNWFDEVLLRFEDRILPLDIAAARIAGRLADAAFSIGRHPGFADIAIAAIAQANDLTLVTRNTKHFDKLGIALLDPFEAR